MTKLYIKCTHRNIQYKIGLSGVFAVKCVNCDQEMPDAYRQILEKHIMTPSSPIHSYPTLNALQNNKKVSVQ